MTTDLLVATAEELFAELCSHQAVQDAERTGWAPAAWSAIAEMGLPWIGVPESAGGQGGTLSEALAVLRVAGRHGLPLPLAETGLLGSWLLASAGLDVPAGPVTVVPVDHGLLYDGRTLTGTATRVPWARSAERVVVLLPADGRFAVASFPTADLRVEPLTNMAGEPRDTVHFAVPVDVVAPTSIDAEQLRLRGALTRVALIAGALERVRDTTVQYTAEREQFGKPLNRFQAIQEHLVHVAQQAALVGAASDVAGRETERGGGAVETACAKSLAAEAVHVSTRAGHQAHGAMGMTQEYSLHQATRRLWSWRREWGDGAFWDRYLGRLVAARGADALYPLIAGGTAALG
ncbi:MAG: acyl-CoA dehydrogenase [Frankiales bacterium]|nr:acyl-CoA dehydrogenase [Frankiales bacterium]